MSSLLQQGGLYQVDSTNLNSQTHRGFDLYLIRHVCGGM